MFEKSLYDLIKGLRQHKGNEKEFIDHSLRECRREIKGSDMDLKATALLKLVYLEMFGHDMSWAAFNILEVMSASKHHQKRIGYLGAVQTFGPNTDVLMLATNLLKKDITSSTASVISLPLVTIPHLVTPGLANAVAPDILARMGHSSSNIRKKSIVTLYRLALAWPEALRSAWPRMKDILENDEEDPSVTATVVNVVCELVWRRPEDFLPLAPRFFELLMNGGNNWMAIKLIKLFAALTPFEPRLVKKLAPALTNLINTTPAMSVLYECIDGIIQGGILDDAQGIREGDEIAELCASKLCGMIAVEGDPNLKYVALLAFNKIVISHPRLVSTQQDVIASCLDDSDISIKTQALTLVSRMVDSDNVVAIVERLMNQLETNKSRQLQEVDTKNGRIHGSPVRDLDSTLQSGDARQYGTNMVQNILDMCSRNMYANINDFDWYIDTLVRLVQLSPATSVSDALMVPSSLSVFERIGEELRNVAVRVKSARVHATEAASNILSALGQNELLLNSGCGSYSVLGYSAFIAGEYPGLLSDSHETLSAILLQFQREPPADVMVSLIQAVPKILGHIFSSELNIWDSQKHSTSALLLARITTAIEPFTTHASIEVQEHAVTLQELSRISEAALAKHAINELIAPTLIRDIFPSLFAGEELNPVAPSAQSKVPTTLGLELDIAINPNLPTILRNSEALSGDLTMPTASAFYYERQKTVDSQSVATSGPASSDFLQYNERVAEPENFNASFDNKKEHVSGHELYDHFNISSYQKRTSTPSSQIQGIIKDSNGQSFDIDSIPIVELDIGATDAAADSEPLKSSIKKPKSKKAKVKTRTQITKDETLDGSDEIAAAQKIKQPRRSKVTRALLQFDSSNLDSLSSSASATPRDASSLPSQGIGAGASHDMEMKKALAEVERLRLEMQRAQDRVAISEDIPQEGTLIAKRRKKKKDRKKGDKKKKEAENKESKRPLYDQAAEQPPDDIDVSYQS